MEEARERGSGNESTSKIPPLKAATVQPVWKNGLLVQSKKPVDSGLEEKLLFGFAQAIKNELLSLVADVDALENFDCRVLNYFVETSEMLPTGKPDMALLFQLTLRETLLYDQIKNVEEQWPDFLADRYKMLCDSLQSYLNRFSARRKFDRDLLESELENVDLDELNSDMDKFGEFLRTEKAKVLIDKSIPDAFELIDADIELMEQRTTLPVPASNATSIKKTSDKAESVSNISKVVFRQAGIENSEQLIDKGQVAYKQSFEDEYVNASAEVGKVEARKAAKAVNRSLVAEEISRSWAGKLATKYPKIFGWMSRFNKGR